MVNDNSSSTSGYAKPDRLIFLAQRDCIFLILDAGMASTANMNLKKGNKKSEKNLQLVFTTNGG